MTSYVLPGRNLVSKLSRHTINIQSVPILNSMIISFNFGYSVAMLNQIYNSQL